MATLPLGHHITFERLSSRPTSILDQYPANEHPGRQPAHVPGALLFTWETQLCSGLL